MSVRPFMSPFPVEKRQDAPNTSKLAAEHNVLAV
jgi:hypothetical protein